MDEFDNWNLQKKSLHHHRIPNFKIRDVWYISLGKNIGFEQNGKGEKFLRPILILTKFNKHVFWAVPLTTKIKDGKFYYDFSLLNNQKILVQNCAILSQLRLFDARRLSHKIGVMQQSDFSDIITQLKNLFAPI